MWQTREWKLFVLTIDRRNIVRANVSYFLLSSFLIRRCLVSIFFIPAYAQAIDPSRPSVMRASRFNNNRMLGRSVTSRTPLYWLRVFPSGENFKLKYAHPIPDIPPYAAQPPPPRLRLVKNKRTQIDANMIRPNWDFRSRLGRTRLRTLCLRKRKKTDTGGNLLVSSCQNDARMIRPNYGFKSRLGHIQRNINK